jgi:DNA-directed RNA polymerase specialized sigma24 family protein
MSVIDRLFARARRRANERAFADWMGSCELPIRRSLERYARAVDVESIVQETFLRMWIIARDADRELTGENASLRFAIGIARNLARAEGRRTGREHLLPPEELPDPPVPPDPVPDPGLRRAIQECFQKLRGKPLTALAARLAHGFRSTDREIAASTGMTLNTFLQNVVRARKQVATCLEKRGIRLQEALP